VLQAFSLQMTHGPRHQPTEAPQNFAEEHEGFVQAYFSACLQWPVGEGVCHANSDIQVPAYTQASAASGRCSSSECAYRSPRSCQDLDAIVLTISSVRS
jgi:hypothetical protein